MCKITAKEKISKKAANFAQYFTETAVLCAVFSNRPNTIRFLFAVVQSYCCIELVHIDVL